MFYQNISWIRVKVSQPVSLKYLLYVLVVCIHEHACIYVCGVAYTLMGTCVIKWPTVLDFRLLAHFMLDVKPLVSYYTSLRICFY